MVIIKGPDEWRLDSETELYPLQLLTDYMNLNYFIPLMLLNR